MMEVTDKREMMANQLLMRGHASMKELLTASFGEWPPKGLNVDPEVKHDQKVLLQVFVQEDLFGQASSVHGNERLIKIDKKSCEQADNLNETLGHETIHILQGDNAHRKQRSFVQKMLYNLFGDSAPASNSIMQKLTGKKEGKLSAEFNKLMELDGIEGWRENVKHMNYLKEGIEVQARIHEFMILGYSRWGRLPAHRDEFLAAMKNSGLLLPPELEQHLEKLPANSSARTFLEAEMPEKMIEIEAVKDVQAVSDSFTKEGQEIFWNKTLPALYGDLVKMYGDAEIAKKFSLDAKTVRSSAVRQSTPSL